jgi:hypothetical protein
VTAKVISTETTQVLGATKATIPRSKEIDEMLAPAKGAPMSEGLTTDGQPPAESQAKDFTAPNSTSVSNNVVVEVVSFRFTSSNGVLTVLRVQNHKTNPIKIGLDSVRGTMDTAATYLADNQGGTLSLIGSEGIGIPNLYFDTGSAKDVFGCLLYIQMRSQDVQWSEQWRKALQMRLGEMMDIGIGESTMITLQFAPRMGAIGSVFRLQAEIIVGELLSAGQVRFALDNVFIDGIHPK